MVLSQQYKTLLDSAFESHFPAWKRMSPSDPLKMLTESLALSLAQIEQRQNRVIDTLLSSLPGLFGFAPKAAKPPAGYYQFSPSSKLLNSDVLSPSYSFRFQSGPCQFDVKPLMPISIAPVSKPEVLRQGSDLIFSFETRGPISELSLLAIPESPTTDNRFFSFKIRVQTASYFREYRPPDLLLHDDTEQLQRTGMLRLFRGQENKKPICEENAKIEVIFSFFSEPPAVNFHLNTGLCEITQSDENRRLDLLKGEAWEEILLPSDALFPPSELELHFPDDHIERLYRMDSDSLKLKLLNPQRFLHSFFYHVENHSLILPAADRLIQNFAGAVQVHAPHVYSMPPHDWYAPRFIGQVGEAIRLVDKIQFLLQHTGAVLRENPEAYLTRFYASLRQHATDNQAKLGLSSKEIAKTVLNFETGLQQVEASIDEEHQQIRVYVLTHPPLKHGPLHQRLPYVPSSLLERIRKKIEASIPIQFEVRVSEFVKVPCQIRLRARLELTEERLGNLTRDSLKKRMSETCLSLLLPPPFGFLEAQVSWPKTAFLKLLTQSLEETFGEGSQLEKGELASLQAWICEGTSSSFVETFERQPGELLMPQVETDVELSMATSNTLFTARSSEALTERRVHPGGNYVW